jgi:hypothetical protein
MDSISSPSPPFTSDPALHDWEEELDTVVLPSSTNSDEFEALHLVQQETIARKNKAGEVIQHRAWALGDTFRSEADYPEGNFHEYFELEFLAELNRNTPAVSIENTKPNSTSILSTKFQNAFCIFSDCISAKLLSACCETASPIESLGASKSKGHWWLLDR